MMQNRSIRSVVFLAIIGAPVFLVGCDNKVPDAEEFARPVKMIRFGEVPGERQFRYPGKVFPNSTVEVAFEVSGRLKEFPVQKGQQVKEGELLGRLDARDFENGVAAAEATLTESAATLARYEEAAKSNAVAPAEVDEARARKRVAEANLRVQEKALEETKIRADFDGVIADRYVDNFQNVVAKQPVLSLQDTSLLEVRVDIPERDAAEDETNLGELRASFDAFPGRSFDLELKEFVTTADPVTQTFAVTLTMPAPEDVEILPGMTATVTWNPPQAGREPSRSLPAVAVQGQAGRAPWVWVVEQDSMRVTQREVQVGSIVKNDQIEIVGGLEPGDLVATAGAHHLSEGMQVREYQP